MAAKRKTSKRSTSPTTVTVPGSPQSAAERRAAEAQLRFLIDTYATEQRRLIGAVRRWLQKRLPTAHELVYEYRDVVVICYSATGRGFEGVFGIHANADGVKLYFNRGQELSDPAKLLQGSGKATRAIHVENAAMLRRPEVAALVEAAIALSPSPFAADGRGTLTVRPTAAQQRRQRGR